MKSSYTILDLLNSFNSAILQTDHTELVKQFLETGHYFSQERGKTSGRRVQNITYSKRGGGQIEHILKRVYENSFRCRKLVFQELRPRNIELLLETSRET